MSWAVLPTRGGSCRICEAAIGSGYSMCTSCRDVAVALGRPPLPVTPIAFVTASGPLYRALRQYKSGEHDVAARQQLRLSALIERFFTQHGGCVAPHGVDVSVVVPSPPGGRPSPHPLAALVARAPSLPPLVDALAPGAVAIAHRRPSKEAYRVAADVTGLRVLLVDDVFTSGAHLQSAAAVLCDAGARTVHAVVVGRFVRQPGSRLRCARCGR